MGTRCIRCNNKKPPIANTGSFLCDDCQEKQFEKYRKLVGKGAKKMSINKVKELLDKGYTPKRVAKELGISVSTVYNYRSKLNKTETNKADDSEVQKLKDEIKKLEREKEAFESKTAELANKLINYQSLKKEYEKLQRAYSQEVESIDVDSILKANNELENKINSLEVALDKEKEMHRKLLEYISLMR